MQSSVIYDASPSWAQPSCRPRPIEARLEGRAPSRRRPLTPPHHLPLRALRALVAPPLEAATRARRAPTTAGGTPTARARVRETSGRRRSTPGPLGGSRTGYVDVCEARLMRECRRHLQHQANDTVRGSPLCTPRRACCARSGARVRPSGHSPGNTPGSRGSLRWGARCCARPGARVRRTGHSPGNTPGSRGSLRWGARRGALRCARPGRIVVHAPGRVSGGPDIPRGILLAPAGAFAGALVGARRVVHAPARIVVHEPPRGACPADRTFPGECSWLPRETSLERASRCVVHAPGRIVVHAPGRVSGHPDILRGILLGPAGAFAGARVVVHAPRRVSGGPDIPREVLVALAQSGLCQLAPELSIDHI